MINIVLSGDLVPINSNGQDHTEKLIELESIISKSDVIISNLECPITSNDISIEKTGPLLKASTDAISILKKFHVNIICLANNHIYDYGDEGLKDTILICEQNGIETVGIVNRHDGREAWLIQEIKGKKIGLLNYCEHEFSVRGEGEIGANGYDPINAFYEIRALRPKVDFLFVVFHGGNELYSLPRPELKRTFRYLANLGADAIIGHHSHVISGYEIYKGKPLVYGLGNFHFPSQEEPQEWHIGLLCLLSVDEGVQVELIPIEQCRSGFKVKPLSGEERSRIEADIYRLSKLIMNEQELSREWKKFTCANKKQLQRQMPGIGRLESAMLKLGIPLEKVLSRKAILSALNRRRCQSHHELMISFLKEMLK